MKTFIVLFVIAVSLPADAQRVKENVRQRVEIVDPSSLEAAPDKVQDKKEEIKESPKSQPVRKGDSQQKQ